MKGSSHNFMKNFKPKYPVSKEYLEKAKASQERIARKYAKPKD